MIVPLWSKAVLVVCAVVLAAFGRYFKGKQKPGAMGGAISAPKAFWLPFAIYLWFVVCPVVGINADVVSVACARPLLWVGVSMWLRGVAEMVMLYDLKNWRPPYGITHDAITIVAVVVAVAVGVDDFAAVVWTPLSMAAALLVVVVTGSLVLEIVHARTFFNVVGARTLGDEGIWFADEHDPRFASINRRTFIGNIVLGVPVALFVLLWCVS